MTASTTHVPSPPPPSAAYTATTPPSVDVVSRRSARVTSIDVVRGAVMILMAIDHVRVYSGVPAGGPTAGLFFTRWITNFVAPAFAFLAGTSAFLYGRRVADRAALARYLATRGVVLVLIELTVLRFAWTFNFDYAHYVLAGVIWMLGWCMVALAALVWLPTAAIAAIGLAMIAGHNVADLFMPTLGPAAQHSALAWLWQLLYFGGPIELGEHGTNLMVLYSLVPWIGVMAAGYAFGTVMTLDPERRHRICIALGAGAIALFLVLRGFDVYGDPRPWNAASQARGPALMRFLNTNKYPASFSFLLMTLGPMFLALPFAERARGPVGNALATFGRVPFFYYLLHIPTIHLAAVIVSLIREGRVNAWLFANHPAFNPPPPDGYRWSLGLLYLVFVIVVTALYFPCRWYAGVKARHRGGWLSYF